MLTMKAIKNFKNKKKYRVKEFVAVTVNEFFWRTTVTENYKIIPGFDLTSVE